jgi:hypothetical protein
MDSSNNQLEAKTRFVPKPPCCRKGKFTQGKKSSYNYDEAKDALGLHANATHLEVYSAAKASNKVVLIDIHAIRNNTPPAISPTRRRLKLSRIRCTLLQQI